MAGQVVTMGAAREDLSVEPVQYSSHEIHHAGNQSQSSRTNTVLKKAVIVAISCVILYGSYTILFDRVVSLGLAGSQGLAIGGKGSKCETSSTKVAQYFQTSPELWAGPTATGKPPFLAQTNPVSFAPTETFAPNTPLETAVPIMGQGQNESIFHLMAHLSPYFPNPLGFGVAEYPLPPGANISQLQASQKLPSKFQLLMLHRCCLVMGPDIRLWEVTFSISVQKLPKTRSLRLLVHFLSSMSGNSSLVLRSLFLVGGRSSLRVGSCITINMASCIIQTARSSCERRPKIVC